MKQVRCNNRNDKQSNFRKGEIYMLYSWSSGNRGKGCKLLKWTPKGFAIIMYMANENVGDITTTDFSPKWLEHDTSNISKSMFFQLDSDEINRHYVMEGI